MLKSSQLRFLIHSSINFYAALQVREKSTLSKWAENASGSFKALSQVSYESNYS